MITASWINQSTLLVLDIRAHLDREEAGFPFLPDADVHGSIFFSPSRKLGGDGEHVATLL